MAFDTTSPAEGRKHRRFPFRGILLVFAVLAGWAAVWVYNGMKRAEATESLGRFPGAQVFWELPYHGAGPLRLLVNDLQAKCVNLTGTQVTDAKLANLRLRAFRDLERLNLWDTGITDAGLEHLRDLSYLQSLSLNDKQITDAGLMKLTVLRRLQELNLAGTKVTDVGLETLTGLDQLRRVVLCGTKVTDAGMEWLERLPQLQTLYLDGTQITDGDSRGCRIRFAGLRRQAKHRTDQGCRQNPGVGRDSRH